MFTVYRISPNGSTACGAFIYGTEADCLKKIATTSANTLSTYELVCSTKTLEAARKKAQRAHKDLISEWGKYPTNLTTEHVENVDAGTYKCELIIAQWRTLDRGPLDQIYMTLGQDQRYRVRVADEIYLTTTNRQRAWSMFNATKVI